MSSPLIFLSHASEDKEKVKEVALRLKTKGYDVWLDEWDIEAGESITKRIENGVERCDYLAIWLTQSAVQSGFVEAEWRQKYWSDVSSDKTIILPLLGEECRVPGMLKDKKYADFRENFEEGMKELLSSLKNLPRSKVRLSASFEEPIRWKPQGLKVAVNVKVEKGSLPNHKVAVFVRHEGEDLNNWHFQFEAQFDESDDQALGPIWLGNKNEGNNSYYDLLVAIVSRERQFSRHPEVVNIDTSKFLVHETWNIYRNDESNNYSLPIHLT